MTPLVSVILTLAGCVSYSDLDLDGFAEPQDCDDRDPAVFPGADDEEGDDVDSNCDGVDGVNRCTFSSDAWIPVLPEEDAEGDNSDYVFDIRDYTYQLSTTTLFLRSESWTPFDRDDGEFQIDMHVQSGFVGFNLSYDSVYPDPSPVQLWSNLNDWSGPVEGAADFVFACDDDEVGVTLGGDLLQLGLATQPWLKAYVSVGWWDPNPEEYEDKAPDGLPSEYGLICVQDGAFPRVMDVSIDDAAGNGDGVIQVGERVDLMLSVDVVCGTLTEPLYAEVVQGTFNVASVEFNEGTAQFGQAGTEYHEGELLPQQSPFELTILEGSQAGLEALVLEVRFFQGNRFIDDESIGLNIQEE